MLEVGGRAIERQSRVWAACAELLCASRPNCAPAELWEGRWEPAPRGIHPLETSTGWETSCPTFGRASRVRGMVDAGVPWLKDWSRWPPARLEGYRGRGWGGHLFHVKEAAMVGTCLASQRPSQEVKVAAESLQEGRWQESGSQSGRGEAGRGRGEAEMGRGRRCSTQEWKLPRNSGGESWWPREKPHASPPHADKSDVRSQGKGGGRQVLRLLG